MKTNTLDPARLAAPSANDNDSDNRTTTEGPPAVRTPKHRPELIYAQQGNLLLPLRFARRMTGWNRNRAN